MSGINVFLLDKSDNIKEALKIKKSITYKQLLDEVRQKSNNMPEHYEIFILENNDKKMIINDEEKFKKIDNILFIKETPNSLLMQSLFSSAYNKLPESEKEKLDEKYNCILCSTMIKKENPYLCYICQKIFHEKCLKNGDEKCKQQKKNLICPNCRNELPIEKWKKKLDYEENRKDDSNLINKIEELNEKEKAQNKLIKKYEKYILITFDIFRKILSDMSIINYLLKIENDNDNILINLLQNFHWDLNNLDIKEIYDGINNGFNKIIKNIKKKNNEKIFNKTEKNIENEVKNNNKYNERLFNSGIKLEKNKNIFKLFKNDNNDKISLNDFHAKYKSKPKDIKNNEFNLDKKNNMKNLFFNCKTIHFTSNEKIFSEKDILYIEIKIPDNETIKFYHLQGNDKKDNFKIININQGEIHKIYFQENNLDYFKNKKIYIFYHKITKNNNVSDIIIGYSKLSMENIIGKKFSGKINIIKKFKNDDGFYEEIIMGKFDMSAYFK